jgi:hypothetical protein
MTPGSPFYPLSEKLSTILLDVLEPAIARTQIAVDAVEERGDRDIHPPMYYQLQGIHADLQRAADDLHNVAAMLHGREEDQ